MVVIALWFVASCALLLTGIVRSLPPGPWLQIFGMWSFAIGSIAFFRWRPLNKWGMGLSLRRLTLFQAWRFIPALTFFYFYYRLGKLPYDFVSVAGYGDLMVAVLAVVAAGIAGSGAAWKWKAVGAFHIFGILDLTAVLVTAIRNLATNPEIMAPFREFPLGLLPLVLVPVTLIAHVIALAKVSKGSM
ncbi:MAG: hypothetical protein HYX26_06125 [Acidobacteriales bacterium]|nr:hypothetical protein [Terriglobales bacterium]